MGNTVMLTIYFPIIIGGMFGVIVWGMSAAGIRHGERALLTSTRSPAFMPRVRYRIVRT